MPTKIQFFQCVVHKQNQFRSLFFFIWENKKEMKRAQRASIDRLDPYTSVGIKKSNLDTLGWKEKQNYYWWWLYLCGFFCPFLSLSVSAAADLEGNKGKGCHLINPNFPCQIHSFLFFEHLFCQSNWSATTSKIVQMIKCWEINKKKST